MYYMQLRIDNSIQNDMKVIGLTGGIGSGKSLIARILLDKYNAYLLNTDAIAKKQMEPDGVSYNAVVQYIGTQILNEDRTINRSSLAQIIFEDKEKRLKINELTHPLVLEEVLQKIKELKEEESHPYLVVETALMIEAGYDFICDEVWYVFAPEEERRRRLKESRNYPDHKIDAIFHNQSKDFDFRLKYTKVIENVGDINQLELQVDHLISMI